MKNWDPVTSTWNYNKESDKSVNLIEKEEECIQKE